MPESAAENPFQFGGPAPDQDRPVTSAAGLARRHRTRRRRNRQSSRQAARFLPRRPRRLPSRTVEGPHHPRGADPILSSPSWCPTPCS